ncbi:immunoglobulin domain-containing protein [Ereboglobus luteus]|uniref:immunoglobulin domain-containing protein n=1 Tax=Ereboglobus luteus TaxID=1796921 RepID=UPI0013751790|nr:immunoglobulin domain-containing protein [Ereboglobus luteus]
MTRAGAPSLQQSLPAPIPTYQWYKDGVAIAGATESALTISSVTRTDAGRYSVQATNPMGSVKALPFPSP